MFTTKTTISFDSLKEHEAIKLFENAVGKDYGWLKDDGATQRTIFTKEVTYVSKTGDRE